MTNACYFWIIEVENHRQDQDIACAFLPETLMSLPASYEIKPDQRSPILLIKFAHHLHSVVTKNSRIKRIVCNVESRIERTPLKGLTNEGTSLVVVPNDHTMTTHNSLAYTFQRIYKKQ